MFESEARPWRYAELRQHLSKNGIAGAVAQGTLVRILPDQYSAALHAESWHVRTLAALSWLGPAAAVSGRTALFAFGALAHPPDILDFTMPWGDHTRGPAWLRVRTTTWTVPTLLSADGTRLVEPGLSLALAHEWEPARTRASLVYDAMRSGRIDAQRVVDALSVVPRMRGRSVLLARLGRVSAGAESYLEERAHVDVLTGSRLGALIRQHRLTLPSGRYRVDAYDELTRTAVEFDGAEHHSRPQARQNDLRRDTELAGAGIMTVRLSYQDVTERSRWCRARLLAILRSREPRQVLLED